MNELREKLAVQEHNRWSRWMRYLFDKGEFNPTGSFIIVPASVARWKRQMSIPYADLSESEKDSDRREADHTLALLHETLGTVVQDVIRQADNEPLSDGMRIAIILLRAKMAKLGLDN